MPVYPSERKTRPVRDRLMEARMWQEFKPRISHFSLQDQHDIEFAYGLAQDAHWGQIRISGEPFFFHPRECATILLEAGVNWARPIILALLHDVPEDTDWLEQAEFPYQRKPFESLSLAHIAVSFSPEIADMLETLTMSMDEYLTKREAERVFHDGFKAAHPDVLLVKMADNLHNLRTLRSMPTKKQRTKIREIKRVYIPLYKRDVLNAYPAIGERLLAQIETTIGMIEAELV